MTKYIDNNRKYAYTNIQYFTIMGYYESMKFKIKYYPLNENIDNIFLDEIGIKHLGYLATLYLKHLKLYKT